ncbi:CheY-like receiver domain-containing protein [Owenweeksia hongkongensis DSM 17368]|uniref:CheY-like receiver domain-containing protein n=1 Tax=Owenweeksia hongkongensis (strain DSM 17368 / CIP 108786 / JCM 12287 / NRRL B-23963 / UST20020801) TaxID=926562 RepID=G8R778_OWEHD|nr:response regulator [Owenweeksia hongkongensis]AEV34485.1 CheY-like receiver domain-containing protein [Owenweeksia hongkongensis DSM 17368]
MNLEEVNLVMLIDDSHTDRFIHKKLLEIYSIGKEVIEFSGAREAIDYLNDAKNEGNKLPDVILLDVLMPEMNGFDFLTSIKSVYPKLVKPPVIYMLSSTDDESDLKRARSIKMVQKLLRKPFSPETLIKALSEL